MSGLGMARDRLAVHWLTLLRGAHWPVFVIDHGMPLDQAVAARRWFIAENELRIEAGKDQSGTPTTPSEASLSTSPEL